MPLNIYELRTGRARRSVITLHRMPDNIYELRTGRARRSVITLHRRWQQDVLRQVRRHAAGRYAWLPQLNQRINRP